MGSRSSGAVLDNIERRVKRKKLFKGSKPHIRKFEIEDMWVLWAAYKEGSFTDLPELTKEQFYNLISVRMQIYQALWLIEDDNVRFKEKRGPVCIVGAFVDAPLWRIEPHVEYFSWATKYNKIRATLMFLYWMSFRKEFGVCVIKSLKNTEKLFRYMQKFIGLNYSGKIENGDVRGDEYVFYLRCKRHG